MKKAAKEIGKLVLKFISYVILLSVVAELSICITQYVFNFPEKTQFIIAHIIVLVTGIAMAIRDYKARPSNWTY